jgi:hypothetical protein
MRKYSENSNLYLINPIPVWKRKITDEEVGQSITSFNDKLIEIAQDYYHQWALEVPDERHTEEKSNISKEYYEELDKREFFYQSNYPAVGKWHSVQTNNFLNLEEKEIILLKEIILTDYEKMLTEYFDNEFDGVQYYNKNHTMDESWMQFYKNGDYKVQHNHLRYSEELILKNIWAGGYYLRDGKPDIRQPYSGRFGFNARNKTYLVKPYEGMILLFPADVVHEVFPFYGESERICLNFNLSTRE